MKQLLPFLGIVSAQPEVLAKGKGKVYCDLICVSLETSLLGTLSRISDDPPLLITTYCYEPFNLIIWIWHHDCEQLINLFTSHGPVSFQVDLCDGSHLERFQCRISALPDKLPSCCIEIRWRKDEKDLFQVTSKVHEICSTSSFYVGTVTRLTGTVVAFHDVESASELLTRSNLSVGSHIQNIRIIPLNELTVVPCKWTSEFNVTSLPSQDKQTSCQELTLLAAKAASKLDEEVMILRAQAIHRVGASSSAEVALVVPTTYDAHILRTKGALSLSNKIGMSLVMLPISEFNPREASKAGSLCIETSGFSSNNEYESAMRRSKSSDQDENELEMKAGESDSDGLWHREATPRSAEPTGFVELRDATVAELFKNLSKWGGHEALENSEIVKNSAQRWEIQVKGSNAEELSRLINRIDVLVAAANKYSESRQLQQWSSQHVDAIVCSIPLQTILRKFTAAVLFSLSDKSPARKGDDPMVFASFCSLECQGAVGLRDWLGDLYPRKTLWNCPKPPPTKAQLCTFMVHVEPIQEKSDSQSQFITLNAWGFGSSLNRAQEEFVVKREKQLSSDDTISNSPVTAQLSPVKNFPIAYPQIPAKAHSPASAAKVTSDHAKHKSSFTFQDREAGVFYQSFETEFRTYMKDLGVEAITADSTVNDSPNWKGSPVVKSTFDSRAPPVKVVLSARTSSDLLEGKAFFDNFLNTQHIARCQISFPKTSVEKYKELLLFKQTHDKRLKMTRDSDAKKSSGYYSNPMNCNGFINIRIKPPLHSKGIKRMQLPCDVTVTLSGPYKSKAQLEALQELEKSFNLIPVDFCSAVCDFPASSPITRQLTVKISREAFIKEYGLAGLRFDEGSKNKGGTAVAKFWSPTSKQLAKVLDVVKQACPETRIKLEGAMPSQLPDYEQSSPLFTGTTKSAVGDLDEKPRPFSSSRPSFSEEFPALSPGAGSSTVRHAFGPELGGTQAVATRPGIDSPSQRSRMVIHWPHLSLRFVFLCDPFKSTLTDIVSSYRSRGLVVTLPYRDKADPTACMLLEGESSLVATCSQCVGEYMDTILTQQRSVHVLLSTAAFSRLTANDLALLKDIQGRCGVHIVLEPSIEELKEAKWRYDISLIPQSVIHAALEEIDTSQSQSSRQLPTRSPFSTTVSPIGSPVLGPSSLNSTSTQWASESLLSSPALSPMSMPPLLGRFSPAGGRESPYFSGSSIGSISSGSSLDFPLGMRPHIPQNVGYGKNSTWFEGSSPLSDPNAFSSMELISPARVEARQSTAGKPEKDTTAPPSTHELIVLRVRNKQTKKNIDIAVLSDSNGGGCAGLGVDCLVNIVDKSADAGLNAKQIEILNRGDPIVDTSAPMQPALILSTLATPTTMIRVRPVVVGQGDSAVQIIALGSSLLNALKCADTFTGNRRVAVIIPEGYCASLPTLSKDAIRRATAKKILHFAQDQDIQNIKRIVLREVSNQTTIGGLLQCSFDDSSTCAGSAFVETILRAIEEESTQLLSFLDAKIVSSIVPMPSTLPREENQIVCLIRGQPNSILRTIQELTEISKRE